MHSFTHELFKVGGYTIHSVRVGQGPLLVLVHGWSNDWQGWQLLAQELAPDYQVLMIDMPGFGDSDPLPEYTIDIQSKLLIKRLQLEKQPVHALVGASLGSIVVSRMCQLAPKCSQRLVLIGGIFSQMSHQSTVNYYKYLLRLAATTSHSQKLLAEIVKNKYTAYAIERFINAYTFDKYLVDTYNLPGRRKMTDKAYVQLGLSSLEIQTETILAELQLPILLIYGESDKYVTPKDARAIVAGMQREKVVLKVIARAGHNPGVERPKRTAKILKNFLKA